MHDLDFRQPFPVGNQRRYITFLKTTRLLWQKQQFYLREPVSCCSTTAMIGQMSLCDFSDLTCWFETKLILKTEQIVAIYCS